MRVEKNANGLYQAKLALAGVTTTNSTLSSVSGTLQGNINTVNGNVSTTSGIVTGVIKNVVNAVSNASTSMTTANGWVEVASVSLTTTRASSKIAVMCAIGGYHGGSTNAGNTDLGVGIDAGTPILVGSVRSDLSDATSWDSVSVSSNYIFSTSGIATYSLKVYARLGGNSSNNLTIGSANIIAKEVFVS